MVEVMTDKATVEIPSPVTGVVEEVFANEGQTIEVGKVLLKITENGGESVRGPCPRSGGAARRRSRASPRTRPKAAPGRKTCGSSFELPFRKATFFLSIFWRLPRRESWPGI